MVCEAAFEGNRLHADPFLKSYHIQLHDCRYGGQGLFLSQYIILMKVACVNGALKNEDLELCRTNLRLE